MVNFEKPPEEQRRLVQAQWYGDAGAGVRRGVNPDVARDLGHIDPTQIPSEVPEQTFVHTQDEPESPTSVPKLRKPISERPKRTRRGLGAGGLRIADSPPKGSTEADINKFS